MRVLRQFPGQELQGNMTSEERVLCFIHHAHAAAAKLASYGIVRDGLPDYGFHDWRPGKDSIGKANFGQAMIRSARTIQREAPAAARQLLAEYPCLVRQDSMKLLRF